MKLLITGVCGFVGSSLAAELRRHIESVEIVGVDNLSRPGSETNRLLMKRLGVRLVHGDVRNPSDLENLPKFDWVIDAAANPSVLAGVQGGVSSRQLLEHNLLGTINLLELCKRNCAGFLLLSTSRVYSSGVLSALPMVVRNNAFSPAAEHSEPGLGTDGVSEGFSTGAPISLYGAAKLASETLAFEYSAAFGIPVQVNRCGVLAGAGQFGKPDQGIFTFWINSYLRRRPMRYIGFGGNGYQTRDCLHPRDLARLVALQLRNPRTGLAPLNVSGGIKSSVSLRQLSDWCSERFAPHTVGADPVERAYDVPWLILDSRRATEQWKWTAGVTLESIFEEIASHAESHPDWLELSSDT